MSRGIICGGVGEGLGEGLVRLPGSCDVLGSVREEESRVVLCRG